METLSSSAITTLTITISKTFPIKLQHQTYSVNTQKNKNHINFSLSSHFSSFISFTPLSTKTKTKTTATSVSTSTPFTTSTKTNNNNNNNNNHHWMVLLESPPQGLNSKSEIIDYYVKTLERVLDSEKDAQMCIYDASFHTLFGFCCDIDQQTSLELASVPGVLSVRPDPDPNSEKKDYKITNIQLSNLSNSQIGRMPLFPVGNTKHWLVRIDKPGVGVVTKAQMVDYYAQILTRVLVNENDAQMCIYHVSWQSNFGFCCELDEECARELAGVPGVLSVQPDENFESENKDYGGNTVSPDSSEASQSTPIKTKKLFVTGLSFYTSEKTLRAAFEGFGELVEVKIIMDKISKRSKGFAFVEYTTEEAASAALKEMNGKIINGWMIVVDVAKTNPPKYSRGRPRQAV